MSRSAATFDPPQHSLDCFQSFQFIFANPKWLTNLLLVSVCHFIPVVGPLVVVGYQFEVAESLLYQNRRNGYREFDFNKFADYLTRGLWPFLATLIASIALMVPMAILWVSMWMLMMVAVAGAGAQKVGPEAGILFVAPIVVMGIVVFVLSLGFHVLLIPLQLRAGYSQDLGEAFHFGFAIDFLRVMWKEIVVAMIFLAVCSVPLMLAGILFCFVGVYFTLSMVLLAHAHLIDFQLYSIYLSRGGEPIPLKRSARMDREDDYEDYDNYER
jgi:hypothetical protein